MISQILDKAAILIGMLSSITLILSKNNERFHNWFYDEETILLADCDLRAGLHAKRWFDAVGHYSRTDVLSLSN